MVLAALLAAIPFDVPLLPDDQQARDLLAEELAKNEYQAAKPTWFDELVSNFFDWLNQLTIGQASGPPAAGLLVVIIVVVAVLVVAFLVFGLPRIVRRSSITGSLFGEDDSRTAAQLRAAAATAAAAGDYSTATAEIFRAIARGLAERTLLSTTPGTTAHSFSQYASRVFPEHGEAFASAAVAFDAVRYLGAEGSKATYLEIASLEESLRASKPALTAVN